MGGHYQPIDNADKQVTVSEWQISLKPWMGKFQGVNQTWLRWYDANEQLILTDAERVDLVEAQKQEAEQRAEAMAPRLCRLGIEP